MLGELLVPVAPLLQDRLGPAGGTELAHEGIDELADHRDLLREVRDASLRVHQRHDGGSEQLSLCPAGELDQLPQVDDDGGERLGQADDKAVEEQLRIDPVAACVEADLREVGAVLQHEAAEGAVLVDRVLQERDEVVDIAPLDEELHEVVDVRLVDARTDDRERLVVQQESRHQAALVPVLEREHGELDAWIGDATPVDLGQARVRHRRHEPI